MCPRPSSRQSVLPSSVTALKHGDSLGDLWNDIVSGASVDELPVYRYCFPAEIIASFVDQSLGTAGGHGDEAVVWDPGLVPAAKVNGFTFGFLDVVCRRVALSGCCVPELF